MKGTSEASSGTITSDITFTAKTKEKPIINYMVCVWGIGEDQYDSIESHKVGLTFGPAIGSSKDCLEHDGHHEHCIHNDS